MNERQQQALSPEKKQLCTYKLLNSGRSRVLLVSMATTLGTRELITEDLNVEETHVSHFKKVMMTFKTY